MALGAQLGASMTGSFGGQITSAIGGLSIGGFNVGGMVNSLTRSDPDISYNYVLEIDGIRSVHMKEVSGLQVQVETQMVREGGNNLFEHRMLKGAKFSNLKIKRGFYSSFSDFFNWIRTLTDATQSVQPRTFSLVVLKDDWSETGRFNFTGGYIVSYQGPSFDAEAKGSIAFEEIEIAYDYFDLVPASLGSQVAQGVGAAAIGAVAGAI